MQKKTMILGAVGLGALVLGRLIMNARRHRSNGNEMHNGQVDAMSSQSFPASDAPTFTPA
ncbi:MAG TPA: hypothetical protein VM328_04825 [Fimbriimonadaceae bacterium]|nr:hypothetical protein [Fimbriimonadaceae bacterium]